MKKTIQTWLNFLLIAGVALVLASSCKKSESTNDPTQSVIIKDIDGNSYTSVTIGTQVWMVENLKTTKYRDGSPIPNVSDNINWSNQEAGAYCNYNNDVSNGTKYGKIYNWYAVNDSRNIAPTGWHVPADNEWEALKTYVAANLSTSGSIAKALAAKTDWASYTVAGNAGNDLKTNNSSGFTALPGGVRDFDGSFGGIGVLGVWWSSLEIYGFAYNRNVGYGTSVMSRNGSDLSCGVSVRCVRD